MSLLENPYMGFDVKYLETEICELQRTVEDSEIHGDYYYAEVSREHLHEATEALLRLAGVRW